MGEHSDSVFHQEQYHHEGMLYVNIMPRGETEGLLAFVVPSTHRRTALNGVHQDAGHQGQQEHWH